MGPLPPTALLAAAAVWLLPLNGFPAAPNAAQIAAAELLPWKRGACERYLKRTGGVGECMGDRPDVGAGGENSEGCGWSVGRSGRGVPLGLVARLAKRGDIDAALHEMRPPHLRPDMPLYHAKDLRVPKSFKGARDGEHGVQFMDGVMREVFGLLKAGAFEVVAE